jgi:TrmH family RNA methyltransferase
MPYKQQLKQIQSLHQKKYRYIHQLFLAEGHKIVEEVINAGYPLKEIYALPSWIDRHEKIIHEKKISITSLTQQEMQKISNLESAQDVIAICKFPSSLPPKLEKGSFYLFIDSIRDPGNLGTIIRTADWFGVKHIFLTEDTVEWTNPKVIQATMGSFVRVLAETVKIPDFFNSIKGELPLYAADIHGESIYNDENFHSGILIVSNESRGLSPQIKPYVDKKISIPRFHTENDRGPESLNAAVACGIILGEIMRRKLKE